MTKKKAVEKAVEIGTRIKARRLQLGLKQRDVQFPGCSYSYLARIENGDRTPKIEVLEGLSEKLDCSVEWLRTGEDELSVTLNREVWENVRAELDWFVREGTGAEAATLPMLVDSIEAVLKLTIPEHPIAEIYREEVKA